MLNNNITDTDNHKDHHRPLWMIPRSAHCLRSRTCSVWPTVARPPRKLRRFLSKVRHTLDGCTGAPITNRSHPAPSQKSDTRPNSPHNYNGVPARGGALPPTPPMGSEASFDGYSHSPSTKSVSQLPTQNYYYDSAPSMASLESEARHQQMVPRIPVQPNYAPAFASSYMSNPAMASYYPHMQPTPPPQVSGLYYQRPLPQVRFIRTPSLSHDNILTLNKAFPPMPMSVAMPPSGPSPWQHHHYISPSSVASFPQSQDRYICQTCNKAFSRPSSLRIHSHSHTGEKPFKCPHSGCGKAFSVRSNMKRHERGCHNFEASSTGSPLALS